MTYVLPYKIPLRSTADIDNIQTGECEIGDGSSSVTDTITAVIKSKSFLVFQYMADVTSDDPSELLVCGEITNSTTLTFERHSTSDYIWIRWFVIEFSAFSSASVQHGSVVVDSDPKNITISAVNLSNSFPIISFKGFGGGLSQDDFITAELTSTTNLQLSVFLPTALTVAKWQVIENPLWTVSKYTDNLTGSTKNTTISAVTLAETWLVGTARQTETGACGGDDIARFNFSSTTNILASRPGTAPNFYLIYYVIEGGGNFDAQHLVGQGINIGSSSNNVSISAVTVANSIIKQNSVGVCQSENITDSSSAGEAIYFKTRFTSSTNAQQARGGSPMQRCKADFEVIDFTNSM